MLVEERRHLKRDLFDEWAIAVALSLRSLPLLIEEMRTLNAARRLRPKPVVKSASDNSLVDIVTTVMSVAIRRADEMGTAITARGGTGMITATDDRPLPDAVASCREWRFERA